MFGIQDIYRNIAVVVGIYLYPITVCAKMPAEHVRSYFGAGYSFVGSGKNEWVLAQKSGENVNDNYATFNLTKNEMRELAGREKPVSQGKVKIRSCGKQTGNICLPSTYIASAVRNHAVVCRNDLTSCRSNRLWRYDCTKKFRSPIFLKNVSFP